MLLVLAAAYAAPAADLCSVIQHDVVATAAEATPTPVPGATRCERRDSAYVCTWAASVADEARFPGAWDTLQARVDGCRLGHRQVEATDDPEILYPSSTWSSSRGTIEVRVADFGDGIELHIKGRPET